MPAPSGQIPPPWAVAGERGSHHESCSQLVAGARPELDKVAEGGGGVVVSLAAWPASPVRAERRYGTEVARKPESPSLGMQEAGRVTWPGLLVCGGAPRRNRTGDPILTMANGELLTACSKHWIPREIAEIRRQEGAGAQ